MSTYCPKCGMHSTCRHREREEEIQRQHDEAYPEHAKLRLISAQSQAIGDFVAWLQWQGIELCRRMPSGRDDFVPVGTPILRLLAQHFGIDESKLEAEKRAMLDALRGGK